MDILDPSALQVLGGWLLVAVLFVLRELASGVLKEAGKALWAKLRKARADGRARHPCRSSRPR